MQYPKIFNRHNLPECTGTIRVFEPKKVLTFTNRNELIEFLDKIQKVQWNYHESFAGKWLLRLLMIGSLRTFSIGYSLFLTEDLENTSNNVISYVWIDLINHFTDDEIIYNLLSLVKNMTTPDSPLWLELSHAKECIERNNRVTPEIQKVLQLIEKCVNQ